MRGQRRYIRPRPAPPDLLRRLPTPAPAAAPQLPLTARPELPLSAPKPVDSSGPAPQICARPAKIEPISDELRVLRMTVGTAFVTDLEAVRDALSHQIPGREFEQVLHHCLRVTMDACRRRRENPLLTLGRRTFYAMLNRISDDRITRDAGDFRLVDRSVLEMLKQAGSVLASQNTSAGICH